MKKTMYLLLVSVLMLSMLAGCKNQEQEEAEVQNMIQGMQKTGEIQPGAKIETKKNESGNTEFSYENPDGSGGGGIAMD